MTLSFEILGPLTVLDDGGTRLIDNLWGAHPPVSARASLHNVVARLRRILGPETICARPRRERARSSRESPVSPA